MRGTWYRGEAAQVSIVGRAHHSNSIEPRRTERECTPQRVVQLPENSWASRCSAAVFSAAAQPRTFGMVWTPFVPALLMCATRGTLARASACVVSSPCVVG